jgi:hypothetical protein
MFTSPLFADEGGGKKLMTKGDAIALLSASDFMRQKIGALLSWIIGYDISKVNRAKLVPIINYIVAVPRKAPPDGRTIIELQASVDDPGGIANIEGVRADLSEIGKLSNMMLVDNGLWGDRVASDGIFTIQTNVARTVPLGEKEVSVAVANKKGWVAMGKTTLEVLKRLTIVRAQALPDKITAGRRNMVLFEVTVVNPDAEEQMRRVFINLAALGGGKLVLLNDEGREGDRNASNNVFSVEIEINPGHTPRTVEIPVYAENTGGAADFSKINIEVVK